MKTGNETQPLIRQTTHSWKTLKLVLPGWNVAGIGCAQFFRSFTTRLVRFTELKKVVRSWRKKRARYPRLKSFQTPDLGPWKRRCHTSSPLES